MPVFKRHILFLTFLSLAASSFSQPRELASIRSGIETKKHLYDVSWVCTGDTIDVDSTAANGIIHQIDGFWITCTEITQELWNWYMPHNPSTVQGLMLPVNNVSRQAADSLCSAIRSRIRSDWRLPTYKEWFFAYSGGLFSEGYRHSGSNHIKFVGWTARNSGGHLSEGARLIPNELGIFDMDGNVAEMVTCGDSTFFAGWSFHSRNVKNQSPSRCGADSTAPECRGLRLVKHEPLWFDAYNERVFYHKPRK